jgi:hypothetical protein
LAKREAQLGQMRDLVSLAARRFEEDGRANAAMNVAERSLGVRVQRFAVRLLACNVCVNCGHETRLTELPKHNAPEAHVRTRRRPKRDERLSARLPKAVLSGDRDPLRQHRQRATCLLILRQRLPLPLEH